MLEFARLSPAAAADFLVRLFPTNDGTVTKTFFYQKIEMGADLSKVPKLAATHCMYFIARSYKQICLGK
jgi:hypothetical protein